MTQLLLFSSFITVLFSAEITRQHCLIVENLKIVYKWNSLKSTAIKFMGFAFSIGAACGFIYTMYQVFRSFQEVISLNIVP